MLDFTISSILLLKMFECVVTLEIFVRWHNVTFHSVLLQISSQATSTVQQQVKFCFVIHNVLDTVINVVCVIANVVA